MTKEEHIKFIERKIQQCIDFQGMEMEKWAFIQCLKNARLLKDNSIYERHERIMKDKNIIISVYTNASGFLWSMCMVDSGTDLGFSEYSGDSEDGGSFTSYNKALTHAIELVEKCDLEEFRKRTNNSHWGLYSEYLIKTAQK